MAKKLLKWRVGERPTGDYASFHYRAWPGAYYNDVQVVQMSTIVKGLGNSEGYDPHNAKTGNHNPLKLMVRIPAVIEERETWSWRSLKGEYKTLDEAKARAEEFWQKNQTLLPKAKE